MRSENPRSITTIFQSVREVRNAGIYAKPVFRTFRGLPRALDGTGRLSVARLGRSKCRAVGPTGETCVFGVRSGDGGGLQKTDGDGR